MSKLRVLFSVLTAVMAVALAKSMMAKSGPALTTVDDVDLTRYVGTWYEIARYPNRFQRNCASDTTAIYSLRPDSKIQVVNSCRKKDGALKQAKGTARVVDKKTNAKLKVTFFWPFSGDYWVLGLGNNYEYAIVGEPSRKYLWILSRTPELNPSLYNRAISQIEAAGYDASKLTRTQQTRAANSSVVQ